MPTDAAIHGAPMRRESPIDHHFSAGRLHSRVSLLPSLPSTVMTLSRRKVIAVALVLIVMVALVIRDRRRADTSAYATSSVAVSIMPVAYSVSEARDRDIEFYTRRAAQDRESAADRAALASLHLARGSATGATTDLDRAEQLARESIRRRTARNGQAFELLATALMARHDFLKPERSCSARTRSPRTRRRPSPGWAKLNSSLENTKRRNHALLRFVSMVNRRSEEHTSELQSQ